VCLLLVGPLLLLVGAIANVPGLLSVGSALLPLAIGGMVLLGIASLEYRRHERASRPANTR
jgi:hypothetical protein